MALQHPQRDTAPPLDLYAGESHIEPARRVFVNRNLKMRSVQAIGFDMDYTIAVYDKYVLEKLAFDATRDKLIAEKHYPEAIRTLEYDPELVIRGLVVDKRLGNVLKIDQYSYVTRAYHGKRLIPSAERKRIYRSTRVRLSSDKYMSIDTLFGLPEAALFLELVDWFELVEKTPWRDYSRLYDDVRHCIDRAHADNTIKREIVRDPARFIVKDPHLAAALAAFRAQGKKLFLLTNSEPYYTETVMRYLLNGAIEQYADWRTYFDVVVVSAGKPDFYQQDRPMPELGASEMEQAGLRPGPPAVYTRGCARLLEDRVGHRGDEILYVGDHTFGDILRAKKRPGWRTAMLIEELRREIELDRALLPRAREIDALLARRTNLALEMNRLRRRAQHLAHRDDTGEIADADRSRALDLAQALDKRVQALQTEVIETLAAVKERKAELERHYNVHWGKLFKCGDINSRFGHQVKDFACLYTSAVSNFLAYPESMYFRSMRDLMPHEMSLDGI
jgi:HAD superfamily 5'-nucleotidase-like hydrolase